MQILSGREFPITRQIEAINVAYRGYAGEEFRLGLTSLAHFLKNSGTNLSLSRICLEQGEMLGGVYVGDFGDKARVTLMGVIPLARRKGIASLLLEEAIKEATERNRKTMTLEVLTENTKAFELYKKHGFQSLCVLKGYEKDAPMRGLKIEHPVDYEEIDLQELSSILIAQGPTNLPFQVSAHSTFGKIGKSRAFRFDSSYVLLVEKGIFSLGVGLIIDLEENVERLQSLLSSLFPLYPYHEWHLLPVLPEHLGAKILEPLGFESITTTQYLMERIL